MKRYTLFSQVHDKAYVGEHPEGDLVKFDEIEQLRAEVERLRVLASTQPMGQPVCDGRCAEAERLRAERDTRAVWTERYIDQLGEMRPVLAAAIELLRKVDKEEHTMVEVEAFLAAQPAAPVRTEEPDVDVSDWAVPPAAQRIQSGPHEHTGQHCTMPCPTTAPTVIERGKAIERMFEDEPAAPVRTEVCTVPPPGWTCSRAAGHDGPCAARAEAERPGTAAPQPPCADCGSTTEDRSCCPLCGKGPFCQNCAERPVDCCDDDQPAPRAEGK